MPFRTSLVVVLSAFLSIGPAATARDFVQDSAGLFSQQRQSSFCISNGRETMPAGALTPEVVDGMLKLAQITPKDTVYDLTFGDGRLAAAAAKQGARVTVIPVCALGVKEARKTAAAFPDGRLTVLDQDFYTVDLRQATVLMLFIVPSMMDALLPKIRSDIKTGTRIVSWTFTTPSWGPPTQTVMAGKSALHLWAARQ
jgi:hypothetical protein